jgi:hypothetical protein
MTDLVERYLAAVGRGLPDTGRSDVLAELRDELLSMVEDREAETGRPLERVELEALLKAYGHPLIVAGRYRTMQSLVGPEVFPFWWAALKIALGVIAGLYLVAIILKVVFDPRAPIVGPDLPDILQTLLLAFGAVTLTAVLIEQMGWSRHLYRWSPRDLPSVRAKPRSPFEITSEIGIEIVFLLWWTGQIRFRELIPARDVTLELSPAWAPFFWPVIAYSLLELVPNMLALAKPGWTRTHASLALARGVFGIALLVAILAQGSWVTVTSAVLDADRLLQAREHIDTIVRFSLAAALCIFAIKAVADLRLLIQAIRDPAPTPPASSVRAGQ